jgi:hypothetical protein
MRDALLDIQRRLERHDVRHTAEADRSRERATAAENRITKLEGAVTTRSWLAGLGVALSAGVSFFARQLGMPGSGQ